MVSKTEERLLFVTVRISFCYRMVGDGNEWLLDFVSIRPDGNEWGDGNERDTGRGRRGSRNTTTPSVGRIMISAFGLTCKILFFLRRMQIFCPPDRDARRIGHGTSERSRTTSSSPPSGRNADLNTTVTIQSTIITHVSRIYCKLQSICVRMRTVVGLTLT